jgi:molybdopterin converting factor small subunit
MTAGPRETFTVRLPGELREFAGPRWPGGPRDSAIVEITPGAAVRDYLSRLGLKSELVMAVVANGKRVDKSYQPVGGDDVMLLAPLSGG